jgi:hypothetical protein
VLAGLLGYGSDRIAELAGRGAVMGPGLGSEIGPLADTPVDE